MSGCWDPTTHVWWPAHEWGTVGRCGRCGRIQPGVSRETVAELEAQSRRADEWVERQREDARRSHHRDRLRRWAAETDRRLLILWLMEGLTPLLTAQCAAALSPRLDRLADDIRARISRAREMRADLVARGWADGEERL